MQKSDVFDSLVVVKRSGQRCDFQGEKIAIAIKKAFDSIPHSYEIKDINLVYTSVLADISKQYQDRKTIKIEDIQDIIVKVLEHKGYMDVFHHYQMYRNQRAISRESFTTKEQHKFLKAMEKLGLNDQEDPKLVGSSMPPQVMFHEFGRVISEEFAQSFLLDHKTVRNLDSGLLYLHDLSTYPMGNPVSVQLLFSQFLSEEEQGNVKDTLMGLVHLIRKIFREQSGNVMIPYFEKELNASLIRHFVSIWKQTLQLKLSSFGLQEILPMDLLFEQFMTIQNLQINLEDYRFFYQDSKQIKDLFFDSYRESLESLERVLREAIDWFIKELEFNYQDNLRHQKVSVSFGTDTSFTSQMIDKILLDELLMLKPVSLLGIFKVKKELHLKEGALLREVCKKAEEAYFQGVLDFEFLDVFYNQSEEDVCYGSGGERAFFDSTTQDGVFVGGKGTLSYTTINLPRIALRHQHDETSTLFYDELKETLEIAKNEMLERLEYQCSKHSYNFPTLIESGIWKFGENVKENDRLRKIWKHGVLQVGFVGLWESVWILLGKREDEEEARNFALSVVTFLRNLLDEYSDSNNLNFTLCGMDFLEARKYFFELDEAIYGKWKGFSKFHLYYFASHISSSMSLEERISIEGLFHSYYNGGHVFLLEKRPKKDLRDILSFMIEKNIGYTHFVTD